MRWKLCHTALVASGLLVHVASFANNASLLNINNNPNSTLLSSTEEKTPNTTPVRKRGGMINPPARPIVEDYDFNLFGDLLVWQAHENGLPIAVKNKATNFTSAAGYQNLQDSSVKHLDFDYNAGFRLGVDHDTAYDGWNVSLTWLRFDAKADAKVYATGNREIFASRLDPQVTTFVANNTGSTPFPIYGKAESEWKGYLIQLDLDMGREFYVSKWVTLRPHFGLRTTWIRQHLTTEYSRGITVTSFSVMPDTEVHEKNKWWGLGVEGGLDTQWMLRNGFSIYGNIAAAIEYGFQKVRENVEVETPVNSTFENNKDSIRMSRPILDLQLGLRWDHGFSNDSYNFGLHAGWEHHVYFSQNQFHVENSLGQFVANQGDLTYQGWTIGAHLAF
jgi:hypothetical protein